MEKKSAMEDAAEAELGRNGEGIDFADAEDAVSAGEALRRWIGESDAPVLFRKNLRGLVSEEDWDAPSSELCLSVGCAGNPIVAVACKQRLCGIVYIDRRGDGDSAVSFTRGLDSEVLSKPLKDAIPERLRGR